MKTPCDRPAGRAAEGVPGEEAALAAEKRELRRQLRQRRPSPEVRDRESGEICAALRAWPVYREARCVALYIPLPHEADLTPLLRERLAEGLPAALPVTRPDRTLCFRLAKSAEDLVPDACGVPTPGGDCPEVPPEDIGLMLVPLEAVDFSGRRLGKGGGCYDRALACLRGGCVCAGAALSGQMLPRVPAGPLDRPVDWLATPRGVIRALPAGDENQ